MRKLVFGARNSVFWGNIAPGAGRKGLGLILGFKGGVRAK